MRKSYSDVLNKSASRAKNSTHLNPSAHEFVPKSNDSWPRVNSQHMHDNVPSQPVMNAPSAAVNPSLHLEIDEPKIKETDTNYSSDGNRFDRRRDAGYEEKKRDSGYVTKNRGKSGNSSEKSQTFYNKKTENWRRREISKDQSGDNRLEFVLPQPPRRMEKGPKNEDHMENPQTLIKKTHASKKQRSDSDKVVSNHACDRYPGPNTENIEDDWHTQNSNSTPTTTCKTLGVSPQKDLSEYPKEVERNAGASLTNTFSGREKERKKDNFTRAESSSFPLRSNDRSITESKNEKFRSRHSSSYLERDRSLEKTRNKTRWSTSACAESDKEKMEGDALFDYWKAKWRSINSSQDKVVHEIFGDLFEQPKEYSLAHCVAEDLRMGSGIAVSFKREFKNLPELFDQRAKQGGLATFYDEKNKRFVYYLVTKKESTGKPTYFTLWKSLCKMRDHVKENKVEKIAIPRIGCGLDRLEWDKVKSMLITLFENVDVEIIVCNFQQDDHDQEKKPTKSPLVTRNSHITEIECNTIILYFTTCKGDEDEIMRNLSEKSKYLPEFRKCKPKALGDIVYFEDNSQEWGLCGCIVRETNSSELSFKSLYKCIQNINKKNDGFRENRFNYIATQWVNSSSYHDELINEKVITMLTTYLRNVSVYVCRGSLENKKSS
ncbi:hypothetical protein HUJ04_006454 [Dendroctonus ponderosae]|uniref:Macro domain-containing protein n=2 Tax=Dendroctonus ponderosae TaxID=77166 RepID=A0AAR5QHI3_DENPD|nr:hypothetical protein HUJ04_006454 [Dendroctonus ponderosae]KAH1005475.1 hypothetical protein HUJ04_006454 [Dendroctonus ponderosae]